MIADDKSDSQKGRAVQEQLRVWDVLIELRIRVQKILLEVNKLPVNEEYWKYVESIPSEGKNSKCNPIAELKYTNTCLNNVLDSTILLKDELLMANTETQRLQAGNAVNGDDEEIRSSDEEMDAADKLGLDVVDEEKSDEEDLDESETETESITSRNTLSQNHKRPNKSDDYESEIKRRCDEFRSYRNQVIQKWNDRTQITSLTLQKKNGVPQISTLKQIEQVLADRERLIRRTQLKRTEYGSVGKKEVGVAVETELDHNPEIFDDNDFYHQLLRELIEKKTASITDPLLLSRHWLELQKLRSKIKRKVDTKASKARKVRYEVYPKLVNVMAPTEDSPMTDHAINELFESLFGTNKM